MPSIGVNLEKFEVLQKKNCIFDEMSTRVRQTEKSFNITSKSTYFCPKGQALLQKKFNLKAITTSSSQLKFLDCPQLYPKVS